LAEKIKLAAFSDISNDEKRRKKKKKITFKKAEKNIEKE
jgi:hypothetical protein